MSIFSPQLSGLQKRRAALGGGTLTNWAAAANGGTVSATTEAAAGFPATATINGDRTTGGAWSNGGGWSSNGSLPQTITYTLAAPKNLSEINVFTLRDSLNDTAPVNYTETFSAYGTTAFSADYWNGSAWVLLFSVTSNNKVGRHFTFAPVTFQIFRIVVTASPDNTARLVEVEAFGI